jgi:hypothetical protein
MAVLSRAAFGAAALLLAFALGACGDSEADQRKAFIAFLQDINGRSGAHYLIPTPADEKAFGPYLQQYTLILDFNKDMRAQSQDFASHMMKLGAGPGVSPRTVEQMAAAPQDLVAAKDELTKTEQALHARLAKATADRTALKQTDDLKAVYDQTFDKLVTAPALAFEKSETALQAGIDASIKLVDYINSHRTRLTISGTQIQAKDQRTLDEIAPLLKAHQEAGQRFAAAQRDTERLMGN